MFILWFSLVCLFLFTFFSDPSETIYVTEETKHKYENQILKQIQNVVSELVFITLNRSFLFQLVLQAPWPF